MLFLLVALIAGFLPLSAQRIDGCNEGRISSLSDAEVDWGLRHSHYRTNEESLLAALSDARPPVRSLAALKLASAKRKRGLGADDAGILC